MQMIERENRHSFLRGAILLFDTVLAIINSGSAGNFKAAAGL